MKPQDLRTRSLGNAAVARANRLVQDLNNAATGIATLYQPGWEKEPVTCNKTMANLLVMVNEEKDALAKTISTRQLNGKQNSLPSRRC